MNILCKTVYDPLNSFCGPLKRAFPTHIMDYDALIDCMTNNDWSLVRKLGAGCSKELLVAVIRKDEKVFFKDKDNEFVKFIGGHELYNCLTSKEKDTYWGNGHLENIIRQCMVVNALDPITSKLHDVVDRVKRTASSHGGHNGTMNQGEIVKSIMSDPSIMTSMFSMIDSPDSMKLLMSSLRKVVDGMMTDGTEYEDSNDHDSDHDQETDELVKDVPSVDSHTSYALASPGSFIKNERKKKKRNLNRKKKSNMSNDPIKSIMSMIGEMEMDEEEMKEVSNDLKNMKPEEFAEIASTVTGMMKSNGLNNGSVDIKSMLNNLSGMDLSSIMKK